MSKKPPAPPRWWKNTYFWIAGILVVIGTAGLIAGSSAVRDPGQRPESNLPLIYFGAAVVMFLNGYLSHKLTVQHYDEQQTGGEEAAAQTEN